MKERQPFEEQEEKKKGRFQSSLYDWGEALDHLFDLYCIVIYVCRAPDWCGRQFDVPNPA